jgi:hypothetical protein
MARGKRAKDHFAGKQKPGSKRPQPQRRRSGGSAGPKQGGFTGFLGKHNAQSGMFSIHACANCSAVTAKVMHMGPSFVCIKVLCNRRSHGRCSSSMCRHSVPAASRSQAERGPRWSAARQYAAVATCGLGTRRLPNGLQVNIVRLSQSAGDVVCLTDVNVVRVA